MTKAEYDRTRYESFRRPHIFGDRRCRCCEIRLVAKHGAHRTRDYCRSCVDNGAARRDQNRRYYAKNRKKVCARSKEYHNTYRSYRLPPYKRWSAKRKKEIAAKFSRKPQQV